MKRVFEYQLQVNDVCYINMPVRAQILSLQVQNGLPCVWALVDDSEFISMREFRTVGTGHPANECGDLQFVGTYQLLDLVFHVFVGTVSE